MVTKPSKTAIENVVYLALEELRSRFSELRDIPKSRNSLLFGTGGALDSLSLVNLVVILEEKLESELGQTVSLVDEKALNQEMSPFHSVGALVDYIESACQ